MLPPRQPALSPPILVLSSTTTPIPPSFFFFFLNDTPPTEIYPLSLHAALPISPPPRGLSAMLRVCDTSAPAVRPVRDKPLPLRGRRAGHRHFSRGPHRSRILHLAICAHRSEEHTSELQSRLHLVCRLLLENKKFRRDGALDRAACRRVDQDHADGALS